MNLAATRKASLRVPSANGRHQRTLSHENWVSTRALGHVHLVTRSSKLIFHGSKFWYKFFNRRRKARPSQFEWRRRKNPAVFVDVRTTVEKQSNISGVTIFAASESSPAQTAVETVRISADTINSVRMAHSLKMLRHHKSGPSHVPVQN